MKTNWILIRVDVEKPMPDYPALCHRHVELPRHTLPSTQPFVRAAVAGMGWGRQPQALIESHLQDGSLVEMARIPLDVPLYGQHARAASAWLDGLRREVLAAADRALLAL
jgi:LysR family transcriptional regulator (chromosome initiation inhibitor)